jgi:hypothetical protein
MPWRSLDLDPTLQPQARVSRTSRWRGLRSAQAKKNRPIDRFFVFAKRY